MIESLKTFAENKALEAEKLRSIGGINLLNIKRKIESALSLIGRNGIFDEYTKHDISHIDAMLESLDWIIPQSTKEQMTQADWLIIVLSIYFHDLGMLVTKDEYNSRNEDSAYLEFKKVLRENIKHKISTFLEEQQERFLYQEYVRKSHGERVKSWILEENNSSTTQLPIIKEIHGLLKPLKISFLHDLALLCESHQLSDLNNFEKYRTSQPYGTTPQEIANIFYAALILRVADLLHITSDRTPTIEYNLINPSDPISQEEWAKQNAVDNVRPQTKKNQDGNLDITIQSDTFEISAFFANEKGYFSLMAYLNYARKELEYDYKLNELAKKTQASIYDFPWKYIDDSSIKANGFEKKQFEFKLDQNRILNLLVGHTLYNNSAVSIREIAQNAIDAVRLKKYEYEQQHNSPKYAPTVILHCYPKERELIITDNGTGMNMEIIENHLLKVGSSRYQDDEFRKKYPHFSSISRFGIGLLTCFLIADDIDILTKTEDLEKALLLKIRKVHGKYLLKHGEENDSPHKLFSNHGTSIRLYVRNSFEFEKIDSILSKWILFPKCKFILEQAGETSIIGFKDPKELLENVLAKKAYNIDNVNYKVIQKEKNGIELAIALKYNKYLKEWNFLEFDNSFINSKIIPSGISIEGINIDNNTPGFDDFKYIAVANASGENVPRTNVARSNIEYTEERNILYLHIYEMYLEHLFEQFKNIEKEFSISWAANELAWMIISFMNTRRGNNPSFIELKSLMQAMYQFKCILIEQNNQRETLSINDLANIKNYWTIECASYTSANNLIKEAKSTDVSALSILNSLYKEEAFTSHIDTLFCQNSLQKQLMSIIYQNFEISEIKIITEQRRLDLKWSYCAELNHNWIVISNYFDDDYNYFHKLTTCFLQTNTINMTPQSNISAIKSSYGWIILNSCKICNYLVSLHKEMYNKSEEDNKIFEYILRLVTQFFNSTTKINYEKFIDHKAQKEKDSNFHEIIWKRINKTDFINICNETDFSKYDTNLWYRGEMY